MSIETFDFRKPPGPSGDISRLLESWQSDMCTTLELQLGRQFSFPYSITNVPINCSPGKELVGRYGEGTDFYRVDVGSENLATGFAIKRSAGRAFAAAILGVSQEPKVAESASSSEAKEVAPVVLTDIERSLADAVIGQCIDSVRESQPFSSQITFTPRGMCELKQLRKEFPAIEVTTIVRFEIGLPTGKQELDWVISPLAAKLFAERYSPGQQLSKNDLKKIAEVATSIPLEVVVRIGSAQVRLAELTSLRVGDVIVLDQSVNEPLLAEIGGNPAFTGWPARVGGRFGYEVHSIEV